MSCPNFQWYEEYSCMLKFYKISNSNIYDNWLLCKIICLIKDKIQLIMLYNYIHLIPSRSPPKVSSFRKSISSSSTSSVKQPYLSGGFAPRAYKTIYILTWAQNYHTLLVQTSCGIHVNDYLIIAARFETLFF